MEVIYFKQEAEKKDLNDYKYADQITKSILTRQQVDEQKRIFEKENRSYRMKLLALFAILALTSIGIIIRAFQILSLLRG